MPVILSAQRFAPFHWFLWKPYHTGIICLPAIPYTPHTPLSPSLSLTHTHMYIHYIKQLGKLGALKTGQAGAVRGRHASMHVKTQQCHWHRPVMRAASSKLKLYWAHYFKWQQSERKFPLKVSDQQCFSHQMNVAPAAPTLSISPSARVTDPCQNTGAQFCSPSRNLCSARQSQPSKRRRAIFSPSFF